MQWFFPKPKEPELPILKAPSAELENEQRKRVGVGLGVASTILTGPAGIPSAAGKKLLGE